MAPYADVWNTATPADGDQLSAGDDRIREAKRALDERLATVLAGWPNTDPLTVLPDAITKLTTGTLAARPNPPASVGLWYYATDTDQLFVSIVGPTWQEAKAATGETAVVVLSAAESQFAPLGTESNAQKVANAVAAATATGAAVKVVFVPRSMWGYAATAGFAGTIFNNAVLMLREGGMAGVYDPVAYGAIIGVDGTVADSYESILAAHTAAGSAGSWWQLVAFTVPGWYKLGTAIPREADVALWRMPGVTLTGAGSFTGSGTAWDLPYTAVTQRELQQTFNSSVAGGATTTGTVTFGNLTAESERVVSISVSLAEGGPSDGIGYGVNSNASSTNFTARLTRLYAVRVGSDYSLRGDYSVTNSSGGALTPLVTFLVRLHA